MTVSYQGVPGLDVGLRNGILTLTMDDASRRNALNDNTVAHLIAALRTASTDDEVRAVLLAGANGDFCSGFDIVDRNAGATTRPRVGSIQRRLPHQAHALIPLLAELQLPIIAAVHGYAVGIGLQILLACDFVVASSTATLWEPFSSRGMTPDSGCTWLLPRVVGPVWARRMLLLGERLTGAQAVECGIVYQALDDEAVDEAAHQLASRLAAGPTVALGLTRHLLNASAEHTLGEQLESEALALELSSRSPDFKEGLRAFIAKRPPEFTGQ
ncbi:enoyl-CoA hydratase/isomerase family protein [Mycobacterium sp. 94-17]|uniref:enoyl-CoA hydratase/isomerase family protein n=1 Tax=Mycobacterium sp. 94-17 TaxID=2986147 RepID=UPI002D1E5DE2|nr:enoyl-CoA hydratase-related protein [Mycobacterium sp. 94-17]MEB4209739.1 enoyl-CoA hydratase-related protein [Mycobacterium sp. 94-17]